MFEALRPDTDNHVLVVGAGPTGLTMANALSEYDVPFCIIEKRTSLSSSSKGLSINVSSQTALDNLGIKEALVSEGCQIQRLHLSLSGRRVSVVDFNHLNPPQHLVTQPQSHTEKNLYNCLVSRGQQVLWGYSLEALQENGGVYHATILTPDGARIQKVFKYIVGCDGKQSIVRQTIGAKFEGPDYPMSFVLGDFEIEGDFSKHDVYYIGNEEEFYIIIPISSRHCRIVTVVDDHEQIADTIGHLLKTLIQRHLGKNAVKKDAIWTSSARIYLKIADKLKKNNLFICGDSSHLVSPIGGTGMNMGIQDAMNLAYKLAYVHHGFRYSDFLSTYEQDRLVEIKETCLRADFMTQLIIDPEFRQENLQGFLPLMANRRLLKKSYPLSFSGLSLCYRRDNNSNFHFPPGSLFLPRAKIINSFKNPNKRLRTLVLIDLPKQDRNTLKSQLIKTLRELESYQAYFYFLLTEDECSYWFDGELRPIKNIDLKKSEQVLFVSPEGIIDHTFHSSDIDSLRDHILNNYLIHIQDKEKSQYARIKTIPSLC